MKSLTFPDHLFKQDHTLRVCKLWYGWLLHTTLALISHNLSLLLTTWHAERTLKCMQVKLYVYSLSMPIYYMHYKLLFVLTLTLQVFCIWMPNPGDIYFSPLSFHGRWGLDFLGFKFPPYRPGNPDDLQSNCEGFISQSNTHGFTNTHSLHMGCPERLHKCTFLPAIYFSSS